MKYFIAHDLGTSGTKSSLFAEDGKLIKSVVRSYEADFNGREATQDPRLLLDAVLAGSKELAEAVDPAAIPAMSFSAQMNACLLVDKDGKPLHDTLIWADTRADAEADEMVERLGFDRIYELTGNRPSANYSLYKLMWMKKHHPEIYRAAAKMLQAKDYVSYRLTGRMVTDHSDASGTGAYDLAAGRWSEELIEAADVRRDLFPEIIRSIEPVGTLLPEIAAMTGLSPDTLVICGGGDGPCATVGAGCVNADEFYLTYGTSAWFGGTTDEPVIDPERALFCFAHIIPDKFMPLGTMQSAGSSYAYVRKLFGDEDTSYADYDDLILSAKPGAGGLIFLPYLIGERSPIWDPHARGAFIGARPIHQKADYVRAVLEGVAFNLEWILSYFRKTKTIETLTITGGGAKSAVTRQILADMLNVTFAVPENAQESTSIAAAIMAGIGSGDFEDFSVYKRFMTIGGETRPDPASVSRYAKLRPIFRDAYRALKPVFADLDTLA